MAELLRYYHHGDSAQSATFTFLLPKCVRNEEGPSDIVSRQFVYFAQKWRLLVTKRDQKHLSPYLEWQSRSPGAAVQVAVQFTIVNCDSYTQNENWSSLGQLNFDIDNSRHGTKNFLTLTDLSHRRGFFHDNLLIELTLRSPTITFNATFNLSNIANLSLDSQTYESDNFNMNAADWQLTFTPNVHLSEFKHIDKRPKHCLLLRRKQYCNTLTKVTYRFSQGDKWLCKEVVSLISFDHDVIENGKKFTLNDELSNYLDDNGCFNVKIHVLKCVSLSHLAIRIDSSMETTKACLTDSENQRWHLFAFCPQRSRPRFTLVYSDIKNIPAGYMRHVSIAVNIPAASKAFNHTTYTKFYASNMRNDENIISLPCQIHTHELVRHLDKYSNQLIVEVEWLASYLLAQPEYGSYEDTMKRHLTQMRRELKALQAENQLLEKEVHKLQISIGNKTKMNESTNALMSCQQQSNGIWDV